ncbi:OmpA family protein [Sphaerisporangium rufum]|uniref:OmpA family protein n=1 Tax=Sphaerisporangium rufum TaxID=1381558 RepID=UPI00195202E4|nr:OmpA family protein [Sphaerisporangium rufum]
MGTALGVRPLAVGERVRVELTALDRVSPRRVVARLRVRNDQDEEYVFGASLSIPWNSTRVNSNNIGGVSLVDGKNGKRYFPLGYRDLSCLCTRGWPRIKPHASVDLVAVFPAPAADVTHLDVLFPPAPPFLDIPLGSARPEPLTVDDSGNDPVDPDSARAGAPEVLSLVEQVDDAVKSRDDDGERLTVRLSTDVLFAVNKAKLTARARQALQQVAAEIDRSPGDRVTIEGHADSTGTDAINDPLSTRRARSVRAALGRLVTRSGLDYRVRGYGSHRPIADNDNAEGRRVNRRVSVIFARPRPAATPVPVPPTRSSGRTGQAGLPVIGTAPAGSAPWIIGPEYWPKRAEVRINELKRDMYGYVALTWTVRNDDERPLNVWSSSHDHSGLYAEVTTSTSAAFLADGDRRYRALRDDRIRLALGPNLHSTDRDQYLVEKGEEYTLWAMFKLPSQTARVTVHIPGFQPVAEVPVS